MRPLIEKIRESEGAWLFVAPVQDVLLSKETNFEFRIDQAVLIDSHHLARRRRRFGFPVRLSELRSWHEEIFDRLFGGKRKTLATMRLTGRGIEMEGQFLDTVADELDLLSLSQLGWTKRHRAAHPSLEDGRTFIRYMMVNATTQDYIQPNVMSQKVGQISIDDRWLRFQKEVIIWHLLRILRSKDLVSAGWRTNLRQAGIFAGRSQTSRDLGTALLWNMIALEALLTSRSDRISERLPDRAEAFIGWTQDWKIRSYRERMKELYRKRSALVHEGSLDCLTMRDLVFTDDLVLNVFSNIVQHARLFRTKQDLIDFSDRVQAEKLLGIRPRVRPKTMRFVRRQYKSKDFQRL